MHMHAFSVQSARRGHFIYVSAPHTLTSITARQSKLHVIKPHKIAGIDGKIISPGNRIKFQGNKKTVLFFGLYLCCYTELCFQVKICRSSCGKVRRGIISGTGCGFTQKSKSTTCIFDKTNKTGH